SIRHEQRVDPELDQDARGERHHLRLVPLVQVRPTLQCDAANSLELARDQRARVSDYPGGGEARDLAERYADGVLQLVAEVAQPRTEHQSHARLRAETWL